MGKRDFRFPRKFKSVVKKKGGLKTQHDMQIHKIKASQRKGTHTHEKESMIRALHDTHMIHQHGHATHSST
jgi:hypothetical protein